MVRSNVTTRKELPRPSLTSSEVSTNSHESRDSSCHDVCELASHRDKRSKFKVSVTRRFVAISLLSSMLIAFASGRAARLLLVDGPRNSLLTEIAKRKERWNHAPSFPSLIALEGREVPHTRYLSKNFDTSRSVPVSSWLASSSRGSCGVERNEKQHVVGSLEQNESAANEATEVDGAPEQTGEHLMVDIKNVDGYFLNSEPRLAGAIVSLVKEADLPLLSYHCHGFNPFGVSCVGVLLRNYLAFHTWPEAGVITFDLFDTEEKSILPFLPIVKRFFGVPRTPSYPGQVIEQPEIRWALKLRGFRQEVNGLVRDLLGDLGADVKEEIASVETDFQRIDIYDVIFPHRDGLDSYKKSLSNDDSYEARNAFLFRPDRVVMLDGVIQSTLFYEAAYHEALVHPALFAHPNPRSVTIVGGGEGATLREVLKHNTVEEAIMIEIDETMVAVSRDSIPEWSDCSDLVGSTPWCVNDPRVTVFYEDALNWFMNRYSDDANTPTDESLDVIILDALDPESEVPIAEALYGNDEFMHEFYNSLSHDGILLMQLGEAPLFTSPDETYSKFRNRAATIALLENLGFESIHVYEEAHCGFEAPWTYVVAFKSCDSRMRWYANAAEVDLEVQRRGIPTKSGASPFHYFDGSTMTSYQVPHRDDEHVFCRRQPMPKECLREIDRDPTTSNIPASTGESGRGLFNPFLDRHTHGVVWRSDGAISKGKEILEEYIFLAKQES